jgi:hypothetical protein
MKKTFISILVFAVFLAGCDKNNNEKPSGSWSNSVFIVNEGPYPTGTGTISAFDRETLEVTNDLFGNANGRPLGNIVQSITVHGDKAFIAVNNANKLEIVNLEDFKSVATINDITNPSYFIGIDEEMGAVSCWDSTVKFISLIDYTVIKSVKVGIGPDEMLLAGDKLFVVNAGGLSLVPDSTVSVVNINDEEVIGRITVGHKPVGIKEDADGNIWILCSGKGWNGYPSADDTPGKLVCFDPDTYQLLKEINFPDSENHPDKLVINKEGNILYYLYKGGVFAFPVGNSALNAQPHITGLERAYGLGYDKEISMLYVTDPVDFSQNGWVNRFRAQDGSQVDSFMAGIVPRGFWFNN